MAKKQVPRPIGDYRRPKPDLYTFMLIVAFIALLVAIVALWAHMAEYNYDIKGGPSVQAPSTATLAAARLPGHRVPPEFGKFAEAWEFGVG